MKLCDHSLSEDEGHRASQTGRCGKDSLLEVEVHARDPEEGPQEYHENEADDEHGDVHKRQVPEGRPQLVCVGRAGNFIRSPACMGCKGLILKCTQ